MGNRTALSQIVLPGAPTTSTQATTKAYADQGMRTVSDLNAIASPATGQLALLTTDLMIYRYTGSAWLGVQHTAAGGGFARYERNTTQSITSNTLTKIAFSTVVSSHADITANGSTDIFTLNRAGTWRLDANLAYPGSTGGTGRTLWIATSTDSLRYGLVNVAPNTGWITALHVTATVVLAAASQVAMWTYQDTGSALTTDVSQIKSSFSLYWEGP